MIVTLAVFSQYIRARRETDRKHIMTVVELAMQLQRSAMIVLINYKRVDKTASGDQMIAYAMNSRYLHNNWWLPYYI